MKFFIDSANIDEIKEIVSLGLVDGVTTNPSLVAKEGRDFKKLVEEISQLVDGPISAEVISTDWESMVEEARELSQIAKNVVIKIPMTQDGLRAVSILSKEGIQTNVTLVFTSSQGLLAARAGATYISPFLGRLDDIGGSSEELIRDLVGIFKTHNIETEIIAASIRNPGHAVEAARLGSHIATVPYKVFKSMLKHPLTDSGLEAFLKDWEGLNK